MMEDRKAPKRTLGNALPEAQVRMIKNQGVVEYDGQMAANSRIKNLGIPVQGSGEYSYQPTTRSCKGKDGSCKARPIKGTDFCIGHKRQNERSSVNAGN